MIYSKKIDLINACSNHNIVTHYYHHGNFRRLYIDLIDGQLYQSTIAAQNEAHKVVNQLFDEIIDIRISKYGRGQD